MRWYGGAGDRHIPAVGLARDRDGLGDALKRAAPVHIDAPATREHQEASVESGPVAILLEGERVEAVSALETRETSFFTALHTAEERLAWYVLSNRASTSCRMWE
jgi:hypothetical protein